MTKSRPNPRPSAQVITALFRESPEAWRRMLIVAGCAGIANAGILALINRGAALASLSSPSANLRLLLLFGLCMLAYYVGKRYALNQACVTVEHMVQSRLLRVSDKIRRSELEIVENLGKGELYTKIAQDTSLISQSGLILVNAAQQAFVLVFCLFYLFWLSKPAFTVTVLVIGVGLVIYARHAQSLGALLRRLTVRQSEQLDALGHIIDGFKEMRLNQRKSDAVFTAFTATSGRVRDVRIATQISFCVDIMFSDLAFYTLLSIVVFMLPRLVDTYAAVVLMTTAAILFIMGPLQMLVQAGPVFQRARNALGNLQELEDRLDDAIGDLPPEPSAEVSFRDFQRIDFDRASFAYGVATGHSGFSVGPLNLGVNRGEILFIVGGNGSGKTTILKMLTGLYVVQGGGLKVDGRLLDRSTIRGYRELFSTVFSDFHLFDRLYGLEGIEDARVDALLKEMELTEKTRFENGRFTVQSLSTGQRKRLALIACLLEDKEILVFDEWAADQDPHFRKQFYEDVLPQLKAQGKTVIAATHDDRYWHVADRVVHIEYGGVVDD